jgi:FkbM family methyltransferase
MKQGASTHFRRRSLEERVAARAGAALPSGVRRILSSAYQWALRRRREHVICRMPGGESVRVLPRYRNISWNPEEYAAFRSDVRAGDVVLDVGANLGAYTLVFGHWVGAGGRVYSFEPAREARHGLEQHVAMNGLAERVVVQPEAVCGVQGVARFMAIGTSGANRLASGEDGEGYDVPTTTIDAFCAPRGLRPTLIKIDVEGAELDVLKGARQTIAAGGDDLRVYVEMHPGIWPGLGISRQHIEAELDAQGLRAECLDGTRAVWDIEGVCLRLRPCAS